MKTCARVRIDAMTPTGVVTRAQLLDVSLVDDDHDFGLHEEDGETSVPEATARGITVLSPVLHLEAHPA